jgi:hypothetical protein
MDPLIRSVVQPSRQPQTRSKVGSTVGRQLHPAHLIVIGVVLLPLLAIALTRGGWPFSFVDAHAYARGLRFWLGGACKQLQDKLEMTLKEIQKFAKTVLPPPG